MKPRWVALGLLMLVPTVACVGTKTCTTEAVASLRLRIVDAETDAWIPGAQVTFTVDGGEEQEPETVNGSELILGYEQTGSFHVSVTADGYEPTEASYEIGEDETGCHPEQQSDTIELTPLEQ